MSNLLPDLAGWVMSAIYTLGYAGVVGLVALEVVIPPIPSELILPLAGFLTGQGRLSFPLVVAAATLGSVAGSFCLYGLGRWLGEARLRRLVQRFGWLLLLKEADFDEARCWFRRHGGKAILIGRLVPGVRSLISIPAGLVGMPVGRFAVYTALGSSFWNGLLVGLGWVLGDQWDTAGQYIRPLGYIMPALLVAGIIWFVWRRTRPLGSAAG